MQVPKETLKRMVLNRLYDHLREHYTIRESRKLFVEDPSGSHSVESATAFKSDIEIEEFKRALDRIEKGNFGVCIRCDRPIPLRDIRQDPPRRICRICEQHLF